VKVSTETQEWLKSIKVGDIVNVSGARSSSISQETVVKVGRKYITTKSDRSWRESQYRIEDGVEKSEFQPVYADSQRGSASRRDNVRKAVLEAAPEDELVMAT
jgi:lysyl-tRNA synthetase class II